VRAHGTHPVTGEALATKDLIKLHFHRNEEGAFACPATGKQFSAHTRVVAIKPTGNVFSWDALESLCLTPKRLKDLLDDTPFTRTDVLVLQDSANPAWVEAHRTGAARVRGAGSSAPAGGEGGRGEIANSGGGTIRLSEATRAILAESAAAGGGVGSSSSSAGGGGGGGASGAHVAGFGVATSGRYSGSATSTALSIVTRNEAAPVAEDADAARWARLAATGQKALVRLVTSLGALNFELHCDLAPRTCENFILLAKRGYYEGTLFHRVIRNFMAQGGDPTATGRGGTSAWGAAFKDEFHPKLGHDGRGVLSMANAGPHTNGSQFFVTFKSCAHLDKKHSVFGRLVGGEEVLRAIELLPVGAEDRPKAPGCTLLRVEVFKNPLELLAAALPAGGRAEVAKRGREGAGGGGGAAALPPPLRGGGSGAADAAVEASAPVGKYLRAPPPAPAVDAEGAAAKRAKLAGGGGSEGAGGDSLRKADFSSW